tara:strand:+ start:327 stop:629 length:303 start_codon:yes stop_codon:yes gene_type:complete
MEKLEKGAKRKCTKCGTLFFDFGRYPLICPNCGADVNSLLTNVTRRGRPPKSVKPEAVEDNKELEVEKIDVADDVENVEDVDSDESNVSEIVEIERDTEN